jgi:hypothetical protein
MLDRFLNWLLRPVGRRPGARRRVSRLTGCLLWILGIILILVLLSLMFGGFQKGTRVSGMASAPISAGAPAGPLM